MSAGEPPATPNPAPPAGGTPPADVTAPPPPEQTGGVSEAIAELWQTVAGTGVFSPRIVGVVAGLVAIVVAWWVTAGSTQRASSQQWTSLSRSTGADLGKFIAESPDTLAGKVARLEEARYVLNSMGLQYLSSRDPERRAKAVANIENARNQFVALVEEFPSDLTLRAVAVQGAAEAELALVGVPTDGKSGEFRGSVAIAAEHYKRLAKAADGTPIGEKAAKRAAELEANVVEIGRTAMALYGTITPRPAFPDFKLPADIKSTPVPAPTPPSGLVPPAPIPPPIPPAPATKPAPAPVPPAVPATKK
ncbi:MAG: hypothetical protein ACRC7O_08930 [Fimbriiglobus sp.]